MAKFELVIKREALKELDRVSSVAKSKMVERIEGLADNPLPDGVKKLEGEDAMFRIRQGDYRAIYTIDFTGRKVTILTVLHRGEGY